MGCTNNQVEYINYDVLNPPVNCNFKNTRVKREDFPEGEIYYLRDKKEFTMKDYAQSMRKLNHRPIMY